MPSRTTLVVLLAITGATGFGCQSGPSHASHSEPEPAATASSGEASIHSIALTDSTPLTTDSATLTVGGLSCPLCANNIENKLGGMKGVQSVSVDLGAGKVKVGFWGKDKPSPMALAKAVKDSGFTPTGIQTP